MTALTDEELIALRKCDAESRFADFPGTVQSGVYKTLEQRGLIKWAPAWRLTFRGKAVLAEALSPARAS